LASSDALRVQVGQMREVGQMGQMRQVGQVRGRGSRWAWNHGIGAGG
jgi:hypothetical protein